MKITEDFIGNETKTLTKTKISTILRWWGFNPDSYSTWGNARSDMNNILSGTPTSEISDRERASTFLSKINYVNDTDAIIGDTIFAAGVPGVWFDPSDMSTLFQDAEGTVPVTAMEQPVGLMLDKSRGKHENGPRRLNLLTQTTFAGATTGNYLVAQQPTGWVKGFWLDGATVAAVTLDGSDYFIRITGTSSRMYFTQVLPASLQDGQTLVVSIQVKDSSGIASNAQATLDFTSAGTGATRQYYLDGVPVASNTQVANGVLSCILTLGTGRTSTAVRFGLGCSSATTGTVVIGRPDIRLLADKDVNPSYQRVTGSWFAASPGNHASQATTTARPTLSSRYNLLTGTDALPSTAAVSVALNSVVAPDGSTTGVTMTALTSNATYSVVTAVATSTKMKFSVYLRLGGTRQTVRLLLRNGTTSTNFINGSFNSSTGVITGSGWTSTQVSGTDWFRCEFTQETDIAIGNNLVVYLGVTGNVGQSVGEYWYLWGPDLRAGNDGLNLPPYQRVTSPTDYDTAGFPPYLLFDGVDDFLATSTIDFTNTDKVSVSAGVRKLSDATTGVVAELSSSGFDNSNTFGLFAPLNASTANTGFRSRGTSISISASYTNALVAAPVTVVMTGVGDIANDVSVLRNNQVQVAQNTTDQGTGQYGNYPLYIGRRGIATLPFKGRLYQLLVRGALSSSAELNIAERFINTKTRAY